MYIVFIVLLVLICLHFDLPSEQLFKQPAETVRNMKQTRTSGQHSFCSEKTERIKSTSAISSSHKMADFRCS
ncbi:unnamed protein product, partial [Coccothraustes coccothraustes]